MNAGNLVLISGACGLTFTSDANGKFLALDSGDGKTLWHAGFGGHIVSSPSSYEVDGRECVLTSSCRQRVVCLGFARNVRLQ